MMIGRYLPVGNFKKWAQIWCKLKTEKWPHNGYWFYLRTFLDSSDSLILNARNIPMRNLIVLQESLSFNFCWSDNQWQVGDWNYQRSVYWKIICCSQGARCYMQQQTYKGASLVIIFCVICSKKRYWSFLINGNLMCTKFQYWLHTSTTAIINEEDIENFPTK